MTSTEWANSLSYVALIELLPKKAINLRAEEWKYERGDMLHNRRHCIEVVLSNQAYAVRDGFPLRTGNTKQAWKDGIKQLYRKRRTWPTLIK